MQLSCSMLITINVDNVDGTWFSNVYWTDSIFFFSGRCGANWALKITNVQLLFIEPYSTPCKRIWIPKSGKFCLWNPESGIFCLWNLEFLGPVRLW